MTRSLPKPINWNKIEDETDLTVWHKLTQNFWLPEKIALSNDLKSWEGFNEDEKEATKRVFAGLTLLDTVQASVGAISLIPDSITPHEEAVYTNIAFMESVHARSYSSIFSTLCSSDDIDELFRWAETDEYLLNKEEIILSHYNGDDPLKRKIASTLLESFLFYSGFYLPLYWSSRAKLTNTADIIKLIIRDEAVHGYYIGYKFQQGLKKVENPDEYHEFTINLLLDLMDNEIQYTRSIYDPIGLTEDVTRFLKYNANKALMNLGFDPIYSADQTRVSAGVLSSLGGGESHDFFSGSGSSYVIGTHEEMEDDDWDF